MRAAAFCALVAFAARMSPMAVANVRQQLALAMQEMLAHRFNSFAGLAAEMVDQHGGVATSVLEQELQLGAITDLWASNEKDGGMKLAGFICEAVDAARQMEADMAEMPDEDSDVEGDDAAADAVVANSTASADAGTIRTARGDRAPARCSSPLVRPRYGYRSRRPQLQQLD